MWWPPLVGLRFLLVDDLLDGLPSLLTGAGEFAHLALPHGVLHLDVAAGVTVTDAAVAAAAAWLVALRQLKVGRVERTLARGTVLARWPGRGMR